jgi:hypothetical protein
MTLLTGANHLVWRQRDGLEQHVPRPDGAAGELVPEKRLGVNHQGHG